MAERAAEDLEEQAHVYEQSKGCYKAGRPDLIDIRLVYQVSRRILNFD